VFRPSPLPAYFCLHLSVQSYGRDRLVLQRSLSLSPQSRQHPTHAPNLQLKTYEAVQSSHAKRLPSGLFTRLIHFSEKP
jgi:hypothetical protein